MQKRTQHRAGKGGERNRKGFDSRQPNKGECVPWHTHEGEIEYYYILSGCGIFTNSDKSEQAVTAGKVCTMQLGGGHAIRQTGDEPLEFIALIITTP